MKYLIKELHVKKLENDNSKNFNKATTTIEAER